MTRLSLFNPNRSVWSDFDQLFADPFVGYTRERAQFSPEADVEETENHYLLSFDLPGINKADVDVSVEGDTLTVTGERKWESENGGTNLRHHERRYGQFSRSFRLPQDVDSSKIEAVHQDGVLRVAVPKIEAVKPKKIEIRDNSEGFFKKILGQKSDKKLAS